MVREELAPRGFWGRVQGVGLIGWVNTRPMVRGTPSARSADAREARFIGEYSLEMFLKFSNKTNYRPCLALLRLQGLFCFINGSFTRR